MAPTATDELNQTGRVLLGMVAEGHRTGYAIKAEIERSTRLYWTASVGGIYPELRRLEQAGLLESRDDPRGGARRRCYSLTDAGHGALTGWLTDDSDPVFEIRNEPLLKLRFAGVLKPAQRVAVLDRMRAYHESRVRDLEHQLADDRFDDAFDRMTTEYSLGVNRWARDWTDRARAAVAGSR